MPDAPASTAGTGTPRDTPAAEHHAHPPLKTPKDKNCPFCGQSFTSSSLGRHLDLYIRPKNPKPADGVHLVDEIRKIRGAITRRQVKAVRKDGTPIVRKHSTATTAAGADSPGPQSPGEDDELPDLVVSKQRRPPTDKAPEVRRDMTRLGQKADLEHRQRAVDEADTARATELALRELLRSVKEANAKATGAMLFDVDLYSLTFPGMCLHVLSPPATLFSPTPFSTSESWSIHPPGQQQYDALNRQVRERLLAHQRQRQINQAYPSGSRSNPSSGPSSPLPTPPLLEPDPQKLFGHIADAYNHWMLQPEQTRQEYWQIEILRSYARARDMHRDAERRLEHAHREMEYLKARRRSWGAWDLSPVSISFGTETVKELGKHGMDFRNWDYDRIVDKWKTIVRESKHASSGMAAQRPLPEPASTRSCSMASLQSQPFVTVSTADPIPKVEQMPYSAPATVIGAEPDSDQVDAEGEDEDDNVDLDMVPASNNTQMDGQPHGMPLQPTPIHPTQMHAHLQSQAQAHAQAQAQAQAQAHAHAQAQAQAQAQQVWAAARQHMNQSRNQHHYPHPQLSPHPHQHMGSANNSRRTSAVLMDPHAINAGMLPMDGIENHSDQFLRMDMGLPTGFVTTNADAV